MIRTACRLFALLLVAATSAGAARQADVSITIDGRIGPLQLDRSTARSIVAFAGRPDAVPWSRFASQYAAYTALGYSCRPTDIGWRFALTPAYKGPFCKTVFYVNRRTGRLADFETSSRQYVGPRGLRVGMQSAIAERRLHQHLRQACGANVGFTTRRADLTLEFVGGSMRPDQSVVGAHLADMVLTSLRHDVGVYALLC
ncbi:MAG TPA: hypothetical protein VF101_09655 [Gaiellaceae bacterium]